MDKKRWLWTGLGVITLAAVYVLGLTQGYHQRLSAYDYGKVFVSELQGQDLQGADLSLLWQVLDTVEQKYYGTPNYEDVLYGVIKGAVAAIGDPYTVFTDPDENKQFFDSLDGVYEGIGVEIDVVNGRLTVIAPLAGSPAEAAGMQAGDVVVAVDGVNIEGLSLAEVVQKIKGPSGSRVDLSILRDGEMSVLEVRRGLIRQASVEVEFDGDIAVVSLYRFSSELTSEFDRIVDQVVQKGAKGIVLDLRNNPGGFLDAGVTVAEEFLQTGDKIVEERFKTGQISPFLSSRDGRLKDIPVVVLVNNGSASAAEIVAGALQDNRQAVVVGEQTFGKGSVQAVEEFPDGSALRVTVAKWYTPAGRSISDEGIAPDRMVEAAEGSDNQLEAAKNALR